jgi:hypothetical protein
MLQEAIQNVVLIIAIIAICYVAGVFFYVGKRNFKYIKYVLPRKRSLATILMYVYYVNCSLLSILSYVMMIFVLLIGIYIQDHYLTMNGIVNIIFFMVYLLFFAAGNIDGKRVVKKYYL